MKITFDGTAGSGKGTIAKKIAEHYSYKYLDTGKLYRAIAVIINEKNILDNYLEYLPLLKESFNEEYLSHKDLHNEETSMIASKVSAEQKIRDLLFDFQRNFIKENPNIVLDGRDMGTVICPEAEKKFYIDAEVKIRAERRFLQNQEYYLKQNITLLEIQESIEKRDFMDKNRKISPLKIATDAIEINNSYDNVGFIVDKIIETIDT